MATQVTEDINRFVQQKIYLRHHPLQVYFKKGPSWFLKYFEPERRWPRFTPFCLVYKRKTQRENLICSVKSGNEETPLFQYELSKLQVYPCDCIIISELM